MLASARQSLAVRANIAAGRIQLPAGRGILKVSLAAPGIRVVNLWRGRRYL